jgi:hypothetical protein
MAKVVEGAALALQSVYNIHGCHCLPMRVFRVDNSILHKVSDKNLKHSARFVIHQAGHAHHASSSSKPTDGRIADALNIIAQYETMTLSTALAEPFSSFTVSCHSCQTRRKQGLVCLSSRWGSDQLHLTLLSLYLLSTVIKRM